MIELGAGKKVPEPGAETPFSAIVGQADLKEALLAVGANDALDGLLVRGEKGTAKSTATRALAELLPEQRAIVECPFGCPPGRPEKQCSRCRERSAPAVETRQVPFVTLPLGASRERVTGTLSVAEALDGSAEFDPGLLARANRGILYVDEVNLLDDHLVDVLLDAAADGRNRVERDGVSVTHPADVTLVGTMNPEEGSLRPQFRDRFALQVEVEGSDDLDDRVRVIRRALSGFDGDYDTDEASTRKRLHAARERLPKVTIPDSLLEAIADLCLECGVEGHRGDIATARAARTIAALDGRERVMETDVQRAAEYALPHRLSARPLQDAPDPEAVIDDHFEDDSPNEGTDGEGDGTECDETDPDETTAPDEEDDESSRQDREPTESPEENHGPGEPERSPGGEDHDDAEKDGPQPSPGEESTGGGSGGRAPEGQENGQRGSDDEGTESDGDEREEATPLVPGQQRDAQSGSANANAPEIDTPRASRPDGTGRSRANPDQTGRGTRVRTQKAGNGDPIDAAASVRSAAASGRTEVTSRDLRSSVRTGEASTLVVFAMDASASMRGPMRAARGVALELLRDAYERRDEVAVVAFAGEGADVVLPPTDSVDRAARHLKSLPTGDRTPLPAGLETTVELLERADPEAAVVVVLTDGRANAADGSPTAATREAGRSLAETDAEVLVVDADGGGRADLTDDIVKATDGDRIPLDALTADHVAWSVPDPGDEV